MKVLFVHQYCGAMGGAETDILLGAGALKDRSHAVALLYASNTGRGEAAWNETFTERYVTGQASTDDVLGKFEPDVIYFHSLPDLGVLKALIDSKVPVVRRVHDHRMYCMRGGKYNYFTRAVCSRPASWRCVFPCLGFVGRNPGAMVPLKWVSYQAKKKEIELNHRCERLLVYSEYQKQELVRNGFDPEKVEVRVPGHDSNTPRFDADDAPETSSHSILFVGQIIRGKGVDLLLRSLAQIDAPFHADIVGEGNHRAYCERLCRKLGLVDQVTFHGFMPHAQLQPFYQKARVLAVSSVWPEPYGLVGREAMYHGVPIVGFDAGGIREWLFDGENGFLVPWADTTAFAKRLEQLLVDKNLARQLGRRGRQLVNQHQQATALECPVEQALLGAARRRGAQTQFCYES